MSEIVTGDDITLVTTLTKNKLTFIIDTLAVVKASVITKDKTTILISETAVLEAATGSDWANSLIIVEFISAQTTLITQYGGALLEIQVDDGGKTTWFVSIEIEQGTIT